MKPIWIVDDDQSIRFVLEKALLREDLPTRSFTNPREVLLALDAAKVIPVSPARRRSRRLCYRESAEANKCSASPP
jgi:CheY-like chemotaxis protein